VSAQLSSITWGDDLLEDWGTLASEYALADALRHSGIR
jgi:hypothetical protein